MLIFIALGIVGYQMVQVWNQADSVYEEAQEILAAKMPDVTILNQQIYNGKEQWIWFEVQDTKGEASHVLVASEQKLGQVDCIIRKTLDGISGEDAKVLVTQSEHPSKITRTVLGVEEGRVIWEITYRDALNKLSYYYLDFTTGEFVKSFTL